MKRGILIYADDVAELEAALARIPFGERVALFSRRDFDLDILVDFYRVRTTRDPRADLAAARVACPGVAWRLFESTGKPLGRQCPLWSPGEDPAIAPTARIEQAPLAVITCYWNYCGFRTPARNLLRFLREMDEAGVPVYGIEMHLPGAEPVMSANPRWTIVEIGTDRMLWQKEAALNRLALEVPAHIPYLAAIDADVHLEDPDWAARTVAALELSPAVQPFTEAVWTDEMGRVELRRTCCARDGLDNRWRTHPGFAWAFRRDFFESGPGFYPWCISGAGDTATTTGLLGSAPTDAALGAFGPRNLTPKGAATKWLVDAADYMAGRSPGWAEGRIWHEWHGTRENRRYLDRHRHMRHVEIGRHLTLGDDGLLVWTPGATRAMREGIAEYFHERKEDG